MKTKTMLLMCVLTLASVLFSSQPVYAVSTLSLSSSGNGGFVLQGEGMDKVAAMDITITFDAATLANPRVAKGVLISGAMMAVNTNVPGTVRMGIITTSPIKNSGIIATLAFDQVGNSPGKIIAIKASVTTRKGNPLPVQAQIVNSPNDPVSTSATPSNAGTQPGATPPPASTPEAGRQVIGVGPVASDGTATTQNKEPAPVPEALPQPAKEKAVVSQETVSSATGTARPARPVVQKKQIYTQKSILVRFREYKGERTVKSLTELFNQDPLIGFKQDPAIVLSDGKSTVKISFIAMPDGNDKPDVKVTGAALLSLKKDPDNTNTWIAELRPGKKVISATLAVSQEKVKMVFPIVVALEADVDLDKSGTVTEADFMVFLRDRDSAQKPPQFDPNNDGKSDFVDDYIFTANYIIKKTVVIK